MYYASAVPCMIALVAFCTWLAGQPRQRSAVGWASRISVVVIAVFNPIVFVALLGGHPEEILGAVLCVAGIAMAVRGNAGWAGLLLGLAIVNKTWALVAAPVALAVMPTDRRRGAVVMVVTAAIVLTPLMALRGNGLSAAAVGGQTGTIVNPAQLLWWFGPHGWVIHHAREIIIGAAVVCATFWSASHVIGREEQHRAEPVLLLLALVLLLRAALDPWNNLYYHLPFIFAVMAYEVRLGRMPLLALGYSLLLFVVVPVHGILHVSPDGQAAIYAAAVLPTVAWIAAKVYLTPRTRRVPIVLPPTRSRRLRGEKVAG
jgi:hypothetical protein